MTCAGLRSQEAAVRGIIGLCAAILVGGGIVQAMGGPDSVPAVVVGVLVGGLVGIAIARSH